MSLESHSISSWIERLKNDDPLAAAALWQRFLERMLAVARGRLRGAPKRVADEEDAVVVAFERFLNGVRQGRFPHLDNRDDLWAVLFTITDRQAEASNREALAIFKKALGEDHPQTAQGYNNLASCLDAQGKQAQPLLEKALAIYRKAPGEEHSTTALSYTNVAFNASAQGRYAEAQPLLEKALAIRKKVLGEEHPDTSASYHHLAIGLRTQGKNAQAMLIDEKALAIARTVFGEDHPRTAGIYHGLAIAQWNRGKTDEAVQNWQAACRADDFARINRTRTGFDRSLTEGGFVTPGVALAAALAAEGRGRAAFRRAEAALMGENPLDGCLTVGTILDTWDLAADLVVLSACRSGRGRDAGGDGLIGFIPALLQKGARSVVVSRWKVDDTATTLLMVRFYENLLGKRKGQKSMGRALALQEARKWLRGLERKRVVALVGELNRGRLRGTEEVVAEPTEKEPLLPAGDKPFAHPFFWAAFILVGDPE